MLSSERQIEAQSFDQMNLLNQSYSVVSPFPFGKIGSSEQELSKMYIFFLKYTFFPLFLKFIGKIQSILELSQAFLSILLRKLTLNTQSLLFSMTHIVF